MNGRLVLLISLIFLAQAILVSPVRSIGQFPPAAVVGRYILQADKYWIAYNKTVEQLRNEGYDVPGDSSWPLQVNYTRLNYTFKCKIVELSWPNVTSQNFEGGYDLNVTAHRIMDDGSIGEKLASFLRPNQPARLGFLWKCHDPGFGVGFNPSAFTIGNEFSTTWPPLNIEYSVDRTEILTDTPWGQSETYVLNGRFENASHCYKNTGWCDAESGLILKLIWDSKTPTYIAHEEMKTVETGIEIAATIDIEPETLNLRSRIRWLTARIELPEGYDVANINVSSILLMGIIPVDLNAPKAIGDYDGDGQPDLEVKFYVRDILEASSSGSTNKFVEVALTISGKLNDGVLFQGSDTIKIILLMP